jgi:sugar phosphate isomerase/epimerase
MKIGISLPWRYLAENYNDKASETVFRDCLVPAVFLKKLKSQGGTSIELRHWEIDLTKNDYIKSFKNITNAGLIFSIHGDIGKDHDEMSIFEAFPWLKYAVDAVNSVEDTQQKEFIITIHPVKKIGGDIAALKDKTEKILNHYCSEIEKNALPVKIAYENQREKGYSDPATQFISISESVTKVNNKVLGTCWDMGHSYANYLKNSYEEMPDPFFLEKAIHTHIHDLSDDTGATHWPLIFGNTPVEKYIKKLRESGYQGTYNLELSTERFSSLNVEDSFFESIDTIKRILK